MFVNVAKKKKNINIEVMHISFTYFNASISMGICFMIYPRKKLHCTSPLYEVPTKIHDLRQNTIQEKGDAKYVK